MSLARISFSKSLMSLSFFLKYFAGDVTISKRQVFKSFSPSFENPSILAYLQGICCNSSVIPKSAQVMILLSRACVYLFVFIANIISSTELYL